MSKKVYIISHSHWDREWYLPYEQHHMRLITLIDDLLEMIHTDPDFHSFHLDGQTIILDDYLEVRPQKEAELRQAIQEGQLKIGPFYILQDDFLISPEANTRNMLIGIEESKKWGEPTMLGYFPDTFGNMGQAPQIMQEAGIKAAAFGRGVKPTGFDNAVIHDEKYASQFSEMWWKGADQSTIFGLLFANWYSNGNEIPAEPNAAKIFWDKKLADAERYASTNHLLMMNGCDHQPLQKDITQAIKTANKLYPDYEFIHSSFDEYLTAVMKDIPKSLSTVSGELTSQETNGWYTLANTSSARIYLKQKNTQVQRQLENLTEPLATMAFEATGKYPHDQLRYAWKLLLQNHPHDSICGCSVDEVHREMMTRFDKSLEVGKFLEQEAMESIAQAIDTSVFPKESCPFVVVNTSGNTTSKVVEVELEWRRLPFSKGKPNKLYEELHQLPTPNCQVIDKDGQVMAFELIDSDVRFNYDLPKDQFRIPYMAQYIRLRLPMTNMPPLSWQTFALVESKQQNMLLGNSMISKKGNQLENSLIRLTVEEDGRCTLMDKKNERSYPHLLTFENVGDVGNEYIFKQPENDKEIFAHNFPVEVKIVTDSPYLAEIELSQTLEIPISAEDLLQTEQKSVTEMLERKANRSNQTAPLTLRTKITMEKDSSQLKCQTRFVNHMKDHRLRVLFPTNISTDVHYAESIYEVVERSNHVEKGWENPSNPQHQHAFVNVRDKDGGLTISNYGLNEYEVMPKENTIALTLLRATGELGDWGYFPTPEAQCLGEQIVAFAIDCHGAEDYYHSYRRAQNFQIPFSIKQTDIHKGTFLPNDQLMEIDSENYLLTCCKRKENDKAIITRGYNLSSKNSCPLRLRMKGYEGQPATLIENIDFNKNENFLKPAEIHTTLWKKK